MVVSIVEMRDLRGGAAGESKYHVNINKSRNRYQRNVNFDDFLDRMREF
jgi:hypothetical protein